MAEKITPMSMMVEHTWLKASGADTSSNIKKTAAKAAPHRHPMMFRIAAAVRPTGLQILVMPLFMDTVRI